jgi:glucose/arabinose dehydrogenase
MKLVRWISVVTVGLLMGTYLASHAREQSAKPELAKLTLPKDFTIQVFSELGEQYGQPRMMTFGADGNLYVALANSGKVVMLTDNNQDGVAETPTVIAKNLNSPNSVVLVEDGMLIANQDGVVKLTKTDGKWSGPKPFISGLPTGGHTLKTLRLGPDNHLYLNVGSSCNVCSEFDPLRATILRFTLDGQAAGHLVTVGRHAPNPTWARGLRNSQGFAWHPVTKAMYATNNGADNRSETKHGKVNDNIPPEHLNQIEPAQHYGWPYCWADPQQPKHLFQDPNFVGEDGFCKTATAPSITFISHSTPIGITFLHNSQFPDAYKSDAIVALHGSWNRVDPSGYKLVRVKFKNNQPIAVEDFATGWLQKKAAWGRPLDVAVGPDGALYVSDDRAGLIYRITHRVK